MNRHTDSADASLQMADDDDPHEPSSGESSSHPISKKAHGHSGLKGWLRRLFGHHDATLKEVIEEAIEEHEESTDEVLAPEEKTMLENVLAIGQLSVEDIMIPRTDIIAVPVDITFDALKAHIIEKRHTRIPLYQDSLDQVEGFLHVKDLFPIIAGDQPFDLSTVMRPMLFIPPSMPIVNLLVKMRREGSHMAIVVDEYGGTDGLVTLEDIVEEIVGDIQDEHDNGEEVSLITALDDGRFELDARIEIEVLEEAIGVMLRSEQQIEDDDFDTLGGLIFFQLGRVPTKGERIEHASGAVFEIRDADARRIKTVMCKLPIASSS